MVSVKPCWRTSRRSCSIMGRPTTGSIGLGWLLVSGRSRAPWPPAMTTTFIPGMIAGRPPRSASGPPAAQPPLLSSAADGPGDVEGVDDGRHVVEDQAGPEGA